MASEFVEITLVRAASQDQQMGWGISRMMCGRASITR